MPLTKRQVDVPISSGEGEKSDIRSLEVTGAVKLENCVRLKNGAIRKRFGNVGLSKSLVRPPTLTTSALATTEFGSVRGAAFGNGALHFDGVGFSRYSEVAGNWEFADVAPEVVALDRIPLGSFSVGGSPLGAVGPDCDGNGNYVVLCYITGFGSAPTGQVTTQVLDKAGTVVMPPTVVYSAVAATPIPWCKVIVIGDTAILAWVDNDGIGNNHIYLSKLDLTNIQAGWSAKVSHTTANILSIVPGFDIAPVDGDSTRFDVAYSRLNAGNVECVVDEVDTATLATIRTVADGAALAGTTIIAYITVKAISGENHWISYVSVLASGASNIIGWVYDDTTHAFIRRNAMNSVAATGFVSGSLGIERIDATHAVYIASYGTDSANGPTIPISGGSYTNYYTESLMRTYSSATGFANVSFTTYSALLSSRPKYVTGPDGISRLYFLATYRSGLQGTQFLMCWDSVGDTTTQTNVPARVVAVLQPRLSKGASLTAGAGLQFAIMPKMVSLNGVTGGNVVATLTNALTTPTSSALAIQPFDFNSQLTYFSSQLAATGLGISGGVPGNFDGQTYAEFSFPYYPEVYNLTGAGTGHQYSYVFVYEYVDASGQVTRSAPSPPISTTGTGGTFHFQTSGFGYRSRGYSSVAGTQVTPPQTGDITVAVYRTTDAGTIYYRCLDSGTSFPTNTFSAGITAAWTDGVTDANLVLNPILYTQGGALPSLIPPSARCLATHKQRYWLAGCDEPSTLWASKAFVQGEVPGFNEAQNLVTAGPVTALVSLDDKLIVFHPSGIEYVTGDGPADNGTQNDWTINPIPSDVGAVDQRCVVVIPAGVTFKSNVGGPTGSGGIFLLSRDLQVHYLSGPVEDTLATYSVVTSATLHPNAGRVYFTLAAKDTLIFNDPGRRVVWDYLTSTWSEDRLIAFDALQFDRAVRTSWTAPGIALNAVSTYSPLLWWSTPDGRVYRETIGKGANAYIDQDATGALKSWVTATFTSAWVKPTLSGFSRFWRVQVQGDALENAGLAVSLTYDYAPSSYYVENFSWTDTQVAAFDRHPQADVEMMPLNQKAKAIQITLSDVAPASYTTGQGFSWASASFELGVDDSRYGNIPSGQRG